MRVDAAVETWAASGAMALTGRPGQPPLGPPAGFVGRASALGEALAARGVEVDPLALLGERAALSGLRRGGDVSCGGSTRLVRAADGWFAVTLARPDDVDALPAWLGATTVGPEPWDDVVECARRRTVADLVAGARLLGMPASALPDPSAGRRPAVVATRAGARKPVADRALVVDLSSLWAGPLCTSLLQQAGARVVKVESSHRPDGARAGPAPFFELLNEGKEMVQLDFRSPGDIEHLRGLLLRADVVVEASRPRALEQLGLVAMDLLRDPAGPTVWLSITGYGREAPGRDWVAFGDDAAVAGGLVSWDPAGPCFCADAVADPLTGLAAACAALDALEGGSSALLDVAMAAVAAELAGPTLEVPAGVEVRLPVARSRRR